MKPESAEELAKICTGMLDKVGEESYRATASMLGGKKPAEMDYKSWVRSAFIAKMLELPEPTPEQMEEARYLGKHVIGITRAALLTYAKTLPHGRGGRPKSLKSPDDRKACLDMRKLLYDGVEKRDALNRIALKYGVSVWTVGRMWRDFQKSTRKHHYSKSPNRSRHKTTRR